jgi:ribosomal protein S18 acetylase RimI-like enzyme
MEERISIRQVTEPGGIDCLRQLWVDLHDHHKSVSTYDRLVVDNDISWHRRRAVYEGWLSDESALIFVAERNGQPIAYLAAHKVHGPDDTFEVGEGYAELFSLSVSPAERGRGVGQALLSTLDDALAPNGIENVVVAVMCGNDDAMRFYRRAGFEPAELYLWRKIRG